MPVDNGKLSGVSWPVLLFEQDFYPTGAASYAALAQLYEEGMWDEVREMFDSAGKKVIDSVTLDGDEATAPVETSLTLEHCMRLALIQFWNDATPRRLRRRASLDELVTIVQADEAEVRQLFKERFTRLPE